VIREIECEQGSAEWHLARAGIPTASEFECIVAKRKDGKYTADRQKYLLTLLGERMTGEIVSGYNGGHLERGKVMESEARDLYLFRTGAVARQCGFFVNDDIKAGASPDSVLGDDGLLEVKTKLPALHLELLLAGGLPAEHKAQVQGQLLVTGRQWVDFVSYWPKLPLHIVRVERDEPYIAALRQAIADFNGELAALSDRFAEAA
jgi:predicted phage-related endonuclease